jgi:hypothetical protein
MAVLSAPRRRRPSVGGPVVLVAAVAVLLLALPALIPALNPFKEETVDRSGPVLLKSLEDLSEYRAASANLQVIVDVESDTELIPSFIKGERTLFVAAGSVDAAVDFRGLGKDPRAVRVSDDRKAVAITLPAAHLTGARLDHARSRVYDRDRGALDRIEEALSDDGGADQQELYVLAERKLAEAARADPQILRTAEANTKQMLSGMLRGLGFEEITITFARPPV